jgi:hypothetical protein
MYQLAHRAFILTAVSAVALPALADDCAIAAKAAMVHTGRTPVSTTTTNTDSQGKQSTTRTIQTVGDKYVQTQEGKWYSMDIAIKDLIDDTQTTKVVCRSSGRDAAAVVYEIQVGDGEDVQVSRLWVVNNLIFRSETTLQGIRHTTVYDYTHVTPPANVTPAGGR